MNRLWRGLRATGIILILLGLATPAVLESERAKRWAADYVSARLGREVTVDGPLQIDWSLRPVVHLSQVRVANPAWAGPQPMLQIRQVTARLDLGELHRLRLPVPRLALTGPELLLVRDSQGRANWDGLLGDGGGARAADRPITVDDLFVTDGRLRYLDAREPVRVELAVRADPAGVVAGGRGNRRGRDFRLALAGAPLLALSDGNRPYPLTVSLISGATRLSGRGQLSRPLIAGGGRLALALRGEDPAALAPLLGLSLPNLPPYRLRGQLEFGDGIWRVRGLRGRVGDSDLAGDFVVESGERLTVWADLHSQRLDLDDLLPVVGAPPATGAGETASPAQRAQAQREGDDDRVLPDAPAEPARFARMDARVRFRGERVFAPRAVPLDRVSFRLHLDRGVLRFAPLDFGVGGGRVRTELVLDARRTPVRGSLQGELQGVDLRDLLQGTPAWRDSLGAVDGRGEMRFAGTSVGAALDSLDGQVQLYLGGGRIDALLEALAGLNAAKAAVVALAGPQVKEIECGYTRMVAERGVVRLHQTVLSTADSDFTADGRIDFGRERLVLSLEGHPRELSLLTAASPITIAGRLGDAEVSVVSAELLARGLAGLAAGVLAPPLAALPFIQPGGGEGYEQACQRLRARALRAEPAAGSGAG